MLRYDMARRLDGVRWNRFHTTVALALGVGWLLDAFEVTIVGNVIGVFKHLWHLSNTEASWVLSIWFVGLMIGAYGFGFLADRFGRRRLFLLTLALYGSFTLLPAVADRYGMTPALLLLASFWLIGAVAMLPWMRWGVEGRGRALEAMLAPQAAR